MLISHLGLIQKYLIYVEVRNGSVIGTKALVIQSTILNFPNGEENLRGSLSRRCNIFIDNSNFDSITKNLWSHVQSKTKSSPIPETIHLGDTYCSDTIKQSDLFHGYFYK